MKSFRKSNGLFVLAVKLGLKFGPKLASIAVKLLKGLKVGKLALGAATFASYSYLLTWQFALMIMALLFVHESGHVWAMKRVGVKTKGFYFIPLIGGAAIAEESFGTRAKESYIALMGPIFGLAISLVAVFLYLLTKDTVYAASASWMAFVNLINLLPINPLDGGRVLKSITFSITGTLGVVFLLIGVGLSLLLSIITGYFIFGILLAIGSIDFLSELRRENRERKYRRTIMEEFPDHLSASFQTLEEPTGMAKMNKSQIVSSALAYAVLVCLLFSLMIYMDNIPGVDAAKNILLG